MSEHISVDLAKSSFREARFVKSRDVGKSKEKLRLIMSLRRSPAHALVSEINFYCFASRHVPWNEGDSLKEGNENLGMCTLTDGT